MVCVTSPPPNDNILLTDQLAYANTLHTKKHDENIMINKH